MNIDKVIGIITEVVAVELVVWIVRNYLKEEHLIEENLNSVWGLMISILLSSIVSSFFYVLKYCLDLF